MSKPYLDPLRDRLPRSPVGVGVSPIHDPLSDVLDSITLRVLMAERSRFFAPWGVRFTQSSTNFYVITKGRCWLRLDSQPPQQLGIGDFAIINHRQEHCLCDAPDRPAVPLEHLHSTNTTIPHNGLYITGPGELTLLICGSFIINDGRDCPLLTALPPLIHVKGNKETIDPLLNDMAQIITHESQQRHKGALSIISGLAKILLIHAVRSYIETLSDRSNHWFRALMDPHIGPTLGLIHRRPEQPWIVESLAGEAGMSRSSFSARFTEVVGEPPMHYLLKCRMNKACQLLYQNQIGLKELAHQVGYGSEAAFSSAFRRWAGCAPGAYRRAILNPKSSPPAPHHPVLDKNY